MKPAFLPFLLWLLASFITTLHGEAFLQNAVISVEFPDKPAIGDLIIGKFIIRNNGSTPLKVLLADELNIEVKDAQGHPAPTIPHSGAAAGYLVPLPIEIAPGKAETREFLLANYVEIYNPGTYVVSVWSRLGWLDDDPYPVATTKIDFHSPTPQYAAERVHKLCAQPTALDNGYEAGAALERLRDPRYLAPLCQEVEAGHPEACFGIASLLGFESTQVLFKLADSPDPKTARTALAALLDRLPDPDKSRYQGYDRPYRAKLKAIQDTWPANMDAPLMALAEKILLHTQSSDWPAKRQERAPEDYFNLSNASRVSAAAYIVATRGTLAQVPALMAATNDALSARLEPRANPEEGSDFLPAPFGALIDAIDALRHRGWIIKPGDITSDPPLEGSGGRLVLLRQLADPKIPKPEDDGWKEVVAGHLTAQSTVVKQNALQAIPQPFPADWDNSVIAALEDPDLGVVIAACKAAGASGRKSFIRPLAQVLESVREPDFSLHEVRNAATKAAVRLGGSAELWDSWATLLVDEHVMIGAIYQLCTGTIDLPREGSWGTANGQASRSQRFLLRDAWREFLQKHRELLDRGERVPRDDPSIIPILTGLSFGDSPIISIRLANGTEWPKVAEKAASGVPGLPN